MRRNTIAQSIVKRFRKNKISDVLVACFIWSARFLSITVKNGRISFINSETYL